MKTALLSFILLIGLTGCGGTYQYVETPNPQPSYIYGFINEDQAWCGFGHVINNGTNISSSSNQLPLDPDLVFNNSVSVKFQIESGEQVVFQTQIIVVGNEPNPDFEEMCVTRVK